MSRTAKRINTLGIRPKAQNKSSCRHNEAGRWNSRTVLNLLRNLAYVGIREVNARHRDRIQSRLKPHQRYQRVRASWDPIVDPGTFDDVQQILDANLDAERSRLNGSEERIFLLSGLLNCTKCGRPLVGSSGHGAKDVHRYYVHRRIEGVEAECSLRNLRAGEVEQLVLDHLDRRLTQDGYLDYLEEEIANQKSADLSGVQGERAHRARELEELQADIEATFKLLSQSGTPDGVIQLAHQRLSDLGDRKARAEARISELDGQIVDGSPQVREMELVRQCLGSFKSIKRSGSRRGLKRLLRRVFPEIRVEPGRLGLCYWTASESAILGHQADLAAAPGQNCSAPLETRQKLRD